MKVTSAIRSGLLLTAASALIAACSGDSDIKSTGDVITVEVGGGGSGGGGGGGGSTGADGQLSFVTSGCPSGTTETTVTVGAAAGDVDVTACAIDVTDGDSDGNNDPITSDLTLTAGNVYILDGATFIGENQIEDASGASATLTIEPGVVVAANTGDSIVDTLIISPGSDIDAEGEANAPIIFTTLLDLVDADGETDATAQAAASDGLANGETAVSDREERWGGLVINGFAPINDCTGQATGTAACTKSGEGNSGLFGGDDPADSSGTLRYVRVQYAGFPFTSSNELNGIAFQGVGSGTEVEFIQVHNNADDGVEFFGGTVSPRYVVITDAGDDSIDWTDGWTGSLQFALVVGGPQQNDNAIEGDNNGDFPSVQPPLSNPTIANLTVASNGTDESNDDGLTLRAGTNATILNTIVTGVRDDGVDFNPEISTGTPTPPPAPVPTLLSVFVANVGGAFVNTEDGRVDILNVSGNGNATNNSDTLNGVFAGTAEEGIEAASADDFTNFSIDATIQRVDYIGAFADNVETIADSWLDGWVLTSAIPDGDAADNCPSGTTENTARSMPAGRTETLICTLEGTITSDLELRSGIVYELDGPVFVGNDLGAAPQTDEVSVTLSIDPGVTIFSASDDGVVDLLAVSRGNRIEVNGTAFAPVIMTNLRNFNGQTPAVEVNQDRWGGLAINGRAPINDCTPDQGTINCQKSGEGNSGLFGGLTPDDDSGFVNYLQIRYAGFPFTTSNELNGIALQGVGNGTELDFIEVVSNADDGIEFFGGTVNASHIIITDAGDDSIDWTDGWQGALQFAVITSGDQTNDNVLEGDNNGDAPDVLPISVPVIANVTSILAGASGNDDGFELRAGTEGLFTNTVIVGVRNNAADFNQASLAAAAVAPLRVPTISSTYLANYGSLTGAAGTPFTDGVDNNVDGGTSATLATDTQTGLELLPNSAILAMTEADLSEAALQTFYRGTSVFADNAAADAKAATTAAFLEQVTYVGAFENDADNWHVGWSFFDEQN